MTKLLSQAWASVLMKKVPDAPKKNSLFSPGGRCFPPQGGVSLYQCLSFSGQPQERVQMMPKVSPRDSLQMSVRQVPKNLFFQFIRIRFVYDVARWQVRSLRKGLSFSFAADGFSLVAPHYAYSLHVVPIAETFCKLPPLSCGPLWGRVHPPPSPCTRGFQPTRGPPPLLYLELHRCFFLFLSLGHPQISMRPARGSQVGPF